jgi:hypothetical protein
VRGLVVQGSRGAGVGDAEETGAGMPDGLAAAPPGIPGADAPGAGSPDATGAEEAAGGGRTDGGGSDGGTGSGVGEAAAVGPGCVAAAPSPVAGPAEVPGAGDAVEDTGDPACAIPAPVAGGAHDERTSARTITLGEAATRRRRRSGMAAPTIPCDGDRRP